MPDHRVDELVGLLVATTGEPLLRPASRRRTGLDPPGPDLRGSQRAGQGEPSGIPAPSDEDESERVVGERRCHHTGAVRRSRPDEHAIRGVLAR